MNRKLFTCFWFFTLCLVPFSFAGELRDVRGPVAIASGWEWLWIVLGVLFLAAVITIALKISIRSESRLLVDPPKTPAEAALAAMAFLERGHLLAEGQAKEYYSRLSDIIRHYIEGRFMIRAPEMTTQEFMEGARRSEKLSEMHKVFLRDFLDASDMVKFARFVPSDQEMTEALRLARRFVQETMPVGSEDQEGKTG